ncbi:ornithine-acyl-ACP acyltransferase [Paracoccus sp. IB05]|uniref:ornithine-acyl-ACP acyltransferase n=1 Tax=Paracoccus sp. IB05 TaxID=2779367 RepID=UPI0018E863E6|nr:ornithine-acyl-ACP acyltransferase [Paracoccus sp. IB05]MBJ2153359.1 ornithine-acyl-ACP acyltransferase [Paracoccus sp. IB05]
MSRGEATIIAPQMARITRGGMRARLADGAGDTDAVMALRHQAWPSDGADPLDAVAGQLMIEGRDGRLLATLRVGLVPAVALAGSYSARYYDLAPLAAGSGLWLEPGRFAAAPGAGWEALRMCWAALARIALEAGVRGLFGCASFPGADWQPHREALALLAAQPVPPGALRPGPRAPERVTYPALAGVVSDHKAALAGMPPLLRFYLSLGGQVSDHAVVDRQLDTLHVFTCVETDRIPKARRESLRALAMD